MYMRHNILVITDFVISCFFTNFHLSHLQMHQQGILKTDDLITRFFRLCTEMCVEISYRAQAEQQHNPAASAAIIRAKCYHNLDAFVRLIALLVKHSGEATNTVTKINLLNKVWDEGSKTTFINWSLIIFRLDEILMQ